MTDAAEEAIRRGERAAAMVNDELFVGAWDAIRAELIETLLNSPVRDAEGREHLYLMLRLLEKLRLVFVAHIESGQIASHNLKLETAERAVNG